MKEEEENIPFNQLFLTYYLQFVRFATYYVRDSQIAEDLTADSFTYYWENRHKLPSDTNVPAYILTSIKNKCLSYLHHLEIQEKVMSQLLTDSQWEISTRIARLEVCEPNDIFTEEIKDIVEKTLNKMPEITRNIFILSRFNNKSHKEIAEQFGISIKSVEAHITKSIKALKINLKDYISAFIFLILQ